MKNTNTLELANFVVTYGEKGLLENLKEYVFPAIQGQVLPGKGEIKQYIFSGVSVDLISSDNIPVLFGRLVKDMDIKAEQIFLPEEDRPIRSDEHMESSPSSFFVINLINHRMAFLHETRRCPTLKDFGSCVSRLIMKEWETRRKKVFKEILRGKNLESTLTKAQSISIFKEVSEKVPTPEVRITPLPAVKSVDTFLASFLKMTSITIKPLKTNNELPNENEDFLKGFEDRRRSLGAMSGKIELTNNVDGLQLDQAKKLIRAVSDGNFFANMKGINLEGNKLEGNLDELTVKIQEPVHEDNNQDRATRLLEKLQGLQQKDYLISNPQAGMLEKARNVVKLILGEG